MYNRHLSRRKVLAIGGGAVTVGITGCLHAAEPDESGDEDTGDNGHNDETNHEHDNIHDHEVGFIEVGMESDEHGSHHFLPHLVHVEIGGTVEWVLESGIHDTVAYHPDNTDRLPSADELRIPEDAEPWASPRFTEPDKSYEHTFEKEGVYDYVCTVPGHEAIGMVGRVIVGWPEPDADLEPALREPSSELPESAASEIKDNNVRTIEMLSEDRLDDDHDDEHDEENGH